ncbi:Hypothetical_protein [Hexamita inflata]|uniref:Hypothetical_protein n=1 Tax=Hexamita inflata TaxID=28002 RepID=A0AA86QVQ9_9EUKA|nr:Hypothetical protein HINF_LOCUS53165 [Hexamita inflata]
MSVNNWEYYPIIPSLQYASETFVLEAEKLRIVVIEFQTPIIPPVHRNPVIIVFKTDEFRKVEKWPPINPAIQTLPKMLDNIQLFNVVLEYQDLINKPRRTFGTWDFGEGLTAVQSQQHNRKIHKEENFTFQIRIIRYATTGAKTISTRNIIMQETELFKIIMFTLYNPTIPQAI